jgi:hypothetical protein
VNETSGEYLPRASPAGIERHVTVSMASHAKGVLRETTQPIPKGWEN